MDNHIIDILTAVGLTLADESAIIAEIKNASGKDILERAWKKNNRPEIALAIAIALAERLKGSRDHILSKLLIYVEQHLNHLDDENIGMYLHIKGYTSWKWENSLLPAIRFLNLSLDYLKQINTASANFYSARVYDTFGQIAYLGGQYEEAITDYEISLKIRKKHSDYFGLALTYGNLGRMYKDSGNFERAIDYFKKDLDITKKYFPELTIIQTQLLSHLGFCHLKINKLDVAKDWFAQSLKLSKIDQSAIGSFFVAIGLGHTARLNNNIETAIYHIEEAKRIVQAEFGAEKKKAFNAITNYLDALILFEQKHYKQSLKIFEATLPTYEKDTAPSAVEMAEFLLDYSKVAQQLDKKTLTATLLKKALKHLDVTSAIEMRQSIEKNLQKYHKESWLEHLIKRFTGLEDPEFLLKKAGNKGFQGDKNHLSILVSDIRGFTEISEGFSPEGLISFINDYFEKMIRCVEIYEGYIDKIIGDALMAVFTMPQPFEDDAERAVYSALLMKETLKKFNDRLGKHQKKLNIGIAIHFGKVVAGLIGSPAKRSYTVLGDTVNTVFRVEEMTKILGVTILLTSELIEQLSNSEKFLLRPLGKYCPRGRQEYVTIFELVGVKEHFLHLSGIESEIELSNQALQLFYLREFDEALTRFETLFQTTKIKAYRILADFAKQFIQSPPPTDWEGEVILPSKK